MTTGLDATMNSLSNILEASLAVDHAFNLDALKLGEDMSEFVPPKTVSVSEEPRRHEAFLGRVKPLRVFEKICRYAPDTRMKYSGPKPNSRELRVSI